jgi:hypothetical protein
MGQPPLACRFTTMTRPTSSAGEVEHLGSVSCPSGVLLILDGGLAWMWSHHRPPLLPDFPDVVGATEHARDLVVRGKDSHAAGLAFDRSNHPLYIYDQPEERVDGLVLAFNDLVNRFNLDASLETLAERIPHRQRVDLVLDAGGGAGVVEFHGLWAVAVSGVPRERSLPVMGERMPAGPDEGRWCRVWIDVGEGEVASTREIGHVLVDEARLMAVDADALAAWDDRYSQDGKADLVFWGRDAAAVAAEIGASPVRLGGEANLFGWLDLPFDDARECAQRVGALHSNGRKFAFDFRPHTHHWQVMRDVRATRTESGMLDLAGARLCIFMTTWGDGAFPVEAATRPSRASATWRSAGSASSRSAPSSRPGSPAPARQYVFSIVSSPTMRTTAAGAYSQATKPTNIRMHPATPSSCHCGICSTVIRD